MTEEVAMRLDSDSSPDLGDEWRYGCPRSPVWCNGGLDETGSEITSACEFTSTTSTISLSMSLCWIGQVVWWRFSSKTGSLEG